MSTWNTISCILFQNKSDVNINIIEFFCENRPHVIVELLNSFKFRLQQSHWEEPILWHLFHICVIVDSIVAFLTKKKNDSRAQNTIEFLIRDILNFFGIVISNSEYTHMLRLAACRYLLKYCKDILPICAAFVEPYLNQTVSILVSITKQNVCEELTDVALKLLQLLVIQQSKTMESSIAQLDNFPDLPMFNEIRKVHSNIKYKGENFTLLQEIEYFLKIEKRRVEGFIALKEQVSTSRVLGSLDRSVFKFYRFNFYFSYRIRKKNSSIYTNVSMNREVSRKTVIKVFCIAWCSPCFKPCRAWILKKV